MMTMTRETKHRTNKRCTSTSGRTIVGHDDMPAAARTAGYGNFLYALLAMLAMLGVTVPSGSLFAQQDPCYADTLKLNTGYDHNTNAVIPIGAYNLFWRVIQDPDPGTTEPRPSVAINNHPAWLPAMPGTQWISSYPTAQNDRNGEYVFEACFCLKEKYGAVKMEFDLLADDSATVYVNGIYAGTTATWPQYHFQKKTHIIINNPQFFRPGKNCVQVHVFNTGNVAMGFDLAGYIYAGGVGLLKPKCCDSTGAVIGQKFQDLNCNGKKDAGEPGLSGWTIKLSNGMTTTTDALGNYYFFNVPAGTYVAYEVNQPGWTQTYPVSLTYNVTVGAGQVVSNIDFGNCRKDEPCITFGDNTIECTTLPGTTQKAYKLTQWMKSKFQNCPQQTANIVSISPAGINVTPSSFSMTPTMSPTTFYIYGPGATAGTTVSIIIRVCCFNAAGVADCCTDTLVVKLPPCPDDGCFRIVEQKIDCKWTPNGRQFTWCFNFMNQSSFTAYYFAMLPPSGVSIVPTTLIYGAGVPPSTVSPFQCVTISGVNAIPGSTITIIVRMCNKDKSRCCTDSIRVTLPDCPPQPDCCADFRKLIGHLQNAASTNGAASIGGFVSATGPGGSPIVSVSATLVSVSLNGNPAYGYMTGGAISGGWGAGVVPPAPGYPYPHDIVWPMGPGLPGNNFKLGMQFPPMPWNSWHDVLRYCIRLRFTDRNCVTCDTVICITRHRYRIIWWDLSQLQQRGRTDEKGGSRSLQSAGDLPLSGSLTGADSAYIEVNFPTVPPEIGQVKYIGLNVTPLDSGVSIENGTASKSGYDLFFADGALVSFFQANPNDNVGLNLQYAGLGNRASVRNRVELVYTVTTSEGTDTLTEETVLTLRSAGAQGGDKAGPTISDLRNVRTYAIHLTNANGSKSPIAAFSIGEPGTQRVIAVGPVSGATQHTFSVAKRIDKGYAVGAVLDSVIAVEPGDDISPIYVTVSGVDANAVTLGFTTYDSEGQVISEGQLTLSDPLSAVGRDDDGGAAATAMLGQSFPNPAMHSATISFALPTADENVSLLVTDAAGRVVSRLIDGERTGAGQHAVYFDTANLPSGTYYYTLRTGSGSETRSMQVVK